MDTVRIHILQRAEQEKQGFLLPDPYVLPRDQIIHPAHSNTSALMDFLRFFTKYVILCFSVSLVYINFVLNHHRTFHYLECVVI